MPWWGLDPMGQRLTQAQLMYQAPPAPAPAPAPAQVQQQPQPAPDYAEQAVAMMTQKMLDQGLIKPKPGWGPDQYILSSDVSRYAPWRNGGSQYNFWGG